MICQLMTIASAAGLASKDHGCVDPLAARALDRRRANVQRLAASLADHLGDRAARSRRVHDAVPREPGRDEEAGTRPTGPRTAWWSGVTS